jgi:hypothetical protein
MVAAVSFTLGLFVALLVTGAKLRISLGIAGMVAAITFLASLFLIGRDRSRWLAKRVAVRRRLAFRVATTEDEYTDSFATSDRELALHLRRRLAAFLDVPEAKIGAHDRLEEFGFEGFMPQIYFFLMAELCENHGIETLGALPKSQLCTVGDLVVEAKALMREKPDKFIERTDEL